MCIYIYTLCIYCLYTSSHDTIMSTFCGQKKSSYSKQAEATEPLPCTQSVLPERDPESYQKRCLRSCVCAARPRLYPGRACKGLSGWFFLSLGRLLSAQHDHVDKSLDLLLEGSALVSGQTCSDNPEWIRAPRRGVPPLSQLLSQIWWLISALGCAALSCPPRGRRPRAPLGGALSSPAWVCPSQQASVASALLLGVWTGGACSRARPRTSPSTCCGWQASAQTSWEQSGAFLRSSPSSCPNSPTKLCPDTSTFRWTSPQHKSDRHLPTVTPVRLAPLVLFSTDALVAFCLCSKTFQVLSYIAKGSFGPILKVKDKANQRTYAVKVSLLHSLLHFVPTALSSGVFFRSYLKLRF